MISDTALQGQCYFGNVGFTVFHINLCVKNLKINFDCNINREKVLSYNVSDNTGQYKILKKTFTQQFSQIYFARLQALRPVILKRLNSIDGIN